MTNPNNTYMGNVVAGGSHHGFWYRLLDRSDGPSFDPNYCPKNIPFGTFYNNSVHSNGRFGVWIFPGYRPRASGGCNDNVHSVARFEYLTSYLNNKGAEWVYSTNVQFRNLVYSAAGIETKTIMFNEDVNTPLSSSFYDDDLGATIADSIIIGNSDSSSNTSIIPSGLVLAWTADSLSKMFTSTIFQTIRANPCVARLLVDVVCKYKLK